MRRRTTRGAGALALAAALAGLAPGALATAASAAPAETRTLTLGREVTATPTGELASATISVPTPTGGRATAPIEVAVDPGTQMVGVSWAGSGDAEVQVAVPEGDGWGAWVDLHADDAPDDDTEGATERTGAGPVWLGRGGIARVRVKVVGGRPADLRVETMRFAARPSARAVTYDRPVTPAGGPAIATRSSWAPGGWQGGREGCSPAPTSSSSLRFSVVHHTAGTNSYAAADVPAILAGIYRFHTGTNGWCDVGYNLFVDRFGTVWEGRTGGIHAPIQGGHAKGFNTNSVGIALLGSHDGVAPSAASLTALRDVLAWKLGSHGVDPTTTTPIVSQGSPRYPEGQTVVLPTIQGHRDSGLTACPGNLLYSRLPGLRSDIAARIAATNVPATWSPSTSGAAFFGRLDDAATGRRAPNGRAGFSTSLVTRSGWPRDALATAIVLTPQTDARIGGPDRLYRAAFGREAETGGLRYWVDQRDAGMSLSTMARLFTVTAEFRNAYDHLGDPDLVTAIYRNVLGREPDAAGRDYWVGRLAGGMTRHQLLASFSESPEHKDRTRVAGAITRAYVVLFDRAATGSERATWAQALGEGTSDGAMVSVLIASPEYAAGA